MKLIQGDRCRPHSRTPANSWPVRALTPTETSGHLDSQLVAAVDRRGPLKSRLTPENSAAPLTASRGTPPQAGENKISQDA